MLVREWQWRKRWDEYERVQALGLGCAARGKAVHVNSRALDNFLNKLPTLT